MNKRFLSRLSGGFSLIELMVALTLAGILLLGLSVFFVSSSRSYSEAEHVSRQIENGRYASALIAEEARHAGFYGEVKNVSLLPTSPLPSSLIPVPGTLPDPCATAIASVKAALPVPIQGIDSPDAAPSCVTDALAGTDMIVVRRANTTTVTAAAADAIAGGYYTQTANCATGAPVFQVALSGASPTNLGLTDRNCTTAMPVRQYHVYIYYVAPCSIATGTNGTCKPTDKALPTLKRVELCSVPATTNPACSGGAGTMSDPEPLVEGIENLQIEYGLDTSGDGEADTFTAKPTTVAQWVQVVAVRFHILARNTDVSPGFTDTKTYALGKNSDGTTNTVTPGGAYRRHNYTELVRVTNVSQRLERTFP
ncbi:MAG TPA: PilW family protein [Tepidisphaeraceae bacterium]|nr:PilW family protein [Tepidisphaeraceae bacterium]